MPSERVQQSRREKQDVNSALYTLVKLLARKAAQEAQATAPITSDNPDPASAPKEYVHESAPIQTR